MILATLGCYKRLSTPVGARRPTSNKLVTFNRLWQSRKQKRWLQRAVFYVLINILNSKENVVIQMPTTRTKQNWKHYLLTDLRGVLFTVYDNHTTLNKVSQVMKTNSLLYTTRNVWLPVLGGVDGNLHFPVPSFLYLINSDSFPILH
jgi:hypothetical protein